MTTTTAVRGAAPGTSTGRRATPAPHRLPIMRVKLCALAALALAGIGTGAPVPATLGAVLAGGAVLAAVAARGGTRLLRALLFVPPGPRPARRRYRERNDPDDRVSSPA